MNQGYRIKKEIRFVGLQRSGNHALINWIMKQSGPAVLFFNDVEPEDPLNERRLIGQSSQATDGAVIDCLIYSYEDRILNVITHPNYYPQKNMYNTIVDERLDVIILRNPFDAFASRLKHTEVSSKISTYMSGLTLPQLWITYAKEFLSDTNLLQNKKIVVNYDLWCVSINYREEVAHHLGVNFTDAGFNEVTHYGQGSSFDVNSFNDRANEMATDQRWIQFMEDEDYANLFLDKLLLGLAIQIFSINPKLQKFIEEKLRPRVSWYASVSRKLSTAFFPQIVAMSRESAVLRYVYFNLLQSMRKRSVSKKS